MSMVETLQRICALQPEYSSQNTPAMQERGHLVRHVLREQLRTIRPQLVVALGEYGGELGFDASDGIGRKTEAPWVRVFAESMSPAPTAGFYVVIHFARDGSAIFVTVGCGSTVWKNGDLIPESDAALKERTGWGRGVIVEQFGSLAPFTDQISLGAKAELPRTFEKATCVAKKLSPSTVTDSEFFGLVIAAAERLRAIYEAQTVGRDVTPADIDVAELQKLANPTRPTPKGQGLRLSVAERRAIEQRAMDLAREWLEGEGYKVTDESRFKPYDYEAAALGKKLKIEVKGTTSDSHDEIFMTKNEVELHRKEKGSTGLIIVSKIRLSRIDGKACASGGEVRAEIGWDVDQWSLMPMAFRVSRNADSLAPVEAAKVASFVSELAKQPALAADTASEDELR